MMSSWLELIPQNTEAVQKLLTDVLRKRAASPKWIFPSDHLHGPVKIDWATRGCGGHGNKPLIPLAPRM